MTAFKTTLCGVICFAALGCGPAGQPGRETGGAGVRIGVYDSRSIAVAAVGSDYYAKHIQPLEEAFREAKNDGNDELVKELEPKVWARRKQSHRQAFSIAPVDEMLEYIKDDLPGITAKAKVGPIISKWDKDALAKYTSASQVDITMLLVEAFKPKAKSLKWAKEIQDKPPVPMKELEEHMAKEGH